ncbi:MAG: outer membrane protein [Geminicoccaceae bacterium]
MKRSVITCGLLASLVPAALAPSQASAQSVGDLYWGVFGGVNFVSDNDRRSGILLNVNFDPGYTVGGQVGYIFGSVRAEAEIEYSEADVAEIGANGSPDATLDSLRGSGGLYFDFIGFAPSNILPYVGAGVGFAGLEFTGDDLSDDEVALTAHGEAGVSFAAATNFDVVVSYRFEWFDSNIGGLDSDITAHQIRAGLRFF